MSFWLGLLVGLFTGGAGGALAVALFAADRIAEAEDAYLNAALEDQLREAQIARDAGAL